MSHKLGLGLSVELDQNNNWTNVPSDVQKVLKVTFLSHDVHEFVLEINVPGHVFLI